MINRRHGFTTFFWNNDKSTKVRFRPLKSMPRLPIVACMVIVLIGDGTVAVAKPKRGWGLPGGHLEAGETAEQAAVREVYEETAVNVNNLRVAGGWLAEKVFDSELNKGSPQKSYQLLFIAGTESVDEFVDKFEVAERAFVPIAELTKHITSRSFEEIYNYLRLEHLI